MPNNLLPVATGPNVGPNWGSRMHTMPAARETAQNPLENSPALPPPPGSDSPMGLSAPGGDLVDSNPKASQVSKELRIFRTFVEGLNPKMAEGDIDQILNQIAQQVNNTGLVSNIMGSQLKGIYNGYGKLDEKLIEAIKTAYPYNTHAKTMKPITTLTVPSVRQGLYSPESAIGRFRTFLSSVKMYYPEAKNSEGISSLLYEKGKQCWGTEIDDMSANKKHIKRSHIEMFQEVFPLCPDVRKLIETEKGAIQSRGTSGFIGENYYGHERPRTPGSEVRIISDHLKQKQLIQFLMEKYPDLRQSEGDTSQKTHSRWSAWLTNRTNPGIRKCALSEDDAELILGLDAVWPLIDEGVIRKENLRAHTPEERKAMKERYDAQKKAVE